MTLLLFILGVLVLLAVLAGVAYVAWIVFGRVSDVCEFLYDGEEDYDRW